MARAPAGVWGIDIGQCALKALRLETVDGQVTATAFDYIEHPKILSQPDADPDQLTRAALEQFLSRNTVKGDEVAISVPGQTGLARFVKLPPVEPKKIPDIVRFEAKQQIPFPLEEVVWDYQTLGSRGGTDKFVENEIGLFAMKRDQINRYLQAFRDVGVELHVVQMAPLALCNFVAYDLLDKDPVEESAPATAEGEGDGQVPGEPEETKKLCVVVLDVGVDNTNLVITDGEKIIWQRPIPIGGNHFTRALTKDFKLTFAKAEHLKRNATKAEDPKKVFQSMKPVFSDFVGEMQRSLGFFTNTHREVEIKRLLGLGNAFRLPGLQKFVSQSLGMELDKLVRFERLEGDEVIKSPTYNENILSFGVAYGLALQGLHLGRLKTNLLPQEIHKQRIIRAKKPWAVAAAACLFIGTALFTMFLSGDFKTAQAAKTEAKKVKEGVVAKFSKDKGEFDSEQGKMKKAIEDAGLILKGSQERPNWLLINRFVNECIPQPDGSNLPRKKDGTNPYWNEAAKRAWDNEKERRQFGRKDEDADPGDLIQININGFYARYCDNTMAGDLVTKLKDPNRGAMVRQNIVENPKAWEKPPDKPGWAMELQGYTFHKDGIKFVGDTLVRNLRMKKYIWVPLNDPAGEPKRMEVSHIAILEYKIDEDWDPRSSGGSRMSEGLRLNELVSPAAMAGGAGGMMMPGGGGGSAPTGMAMGPGPASGASGSGGGGSSTSTTPTAGAPPPQSAQWSGLGMAVKGGTGSGPGMMMGPGRGSEAAPRAMPNPAMMMQQRAGGRAEAGQAQDKKQKREKSIKRTDFVIVFYWVEPLETEGQSGGTGGAQVTGTAGGGAGATPPADSKTEAASSPEDTDYESMDLPQAAPAEPAKKER